MEPVTAIRFRQTFDQINMKKIYLGIIAGTVLGFLDGLSAFFIPEAAPMMTEIIIGSTVKGLTGGLIIGLISKKTSRMWSTVAWSAMVGIVLSILAAIPSGAYVEILIPGVLVGVLTAVIVHRWGK